MQGFKNKPIRYKLMAVMLMTSGVVLLLTCTAYFIYEYYSFRKSLIYQTAILGRMCAANTTGALAFNNAEDAQEVLTSLKVDPHVVSAVLYDEHNRIFARFPKDLPAREFASENRKVGIYFKDLKVVGRIPVMQNDRRLGTLHITSNMDAMYDRFKLYGLIACCVIVVSLLVAYLLSIALQRNISKPILALAGTAKVISDEKDYSVRAKKYGNDEVTFLTDAFNQMVSEIQKQNEQIKFFNHHLEQEVSNRTAELELAYNELEAFSYTVSHDLNAPLRQIDTFVGMYLSGSHATIDDKGKKTFEKITRNSAKMRRLIEDLLAFSKLGRKELTKSEVDMKQIVLEIFEENSKADDGREIDLVLSDIPRAYADETTMKQVWINLISNAMKYSRNNESTRIEIGFEETDESIIYFVQDNGIGFEMQYADKLFIAFQRLHAPGDFEGTGVGLAIVNRIVSKHGGKVWAQSEPNQGARFYFSIPKNLQ